MSWFDQRPDDAMMGSFEAVGAEHIHTVEAAQFREAMAQLGAAVHVVTTAGPAGRGGVEGTPVGSGSDPTATRLGGVYPRSRAAPGRAGFTATAVCSVSDQPATLLVCVNRRSQVTPILDTNRVLCVNTLRAGSDTVADVFAGRSKCTMAERFNTGSWGELATGAPVLTDAVVACDCRVIEIKSVATHNVVFVGVVAVRLGRPGAALVYHERRFKAV